MSKKICILGDSITQGYYDFEKSGWISRLISCLWGKDIDYSVFNLGVSGDTSFDLIKRLEGEFKVRKGKIVIINIGVNDAGTENGKNRTEPEIFKNNLKIILEISKKFTNEIIFTGILDVDEKLVTPVSWDENLCYYNKEIKKYDEVIQNFCQESQLIFIPMQGLLGKEELFDGLHPNAEGHEKIFQRIKNCLEENKII